jgi:LPS-assembly protein
VSLYAVLVLACAAHAQTGQPPPQAVVRPAEVRPAATPAPRSLVTRAGAVPRNEMLVKAVTQELDGSWRRLRGHAMVEVTEMRLTADEIDYSEDTGDVEARGSVHYQNFETGEELWAARVEYNLREETGKFYRVRGTAHAKIQPRPRVLTSTNPFYFESEWAERLKEKYILHQGFITGCTMPRPWWTLRGPRFDFIPQQSALAHRAIFRLRWVPLFYAPVFYKSLEEQPRKSGFLTPNIGNSSRRGKMVGAGYYWAINRSLDLTYRSQLFTQRGFAHNVDFRGKPRAGSDFNVTLYGVNDRGLQNSDGSVTKQGGYLITAQARSDLGHGFEFRADINYLSSFVFRQAFTESFNEAVFSEVHSIGYITKHWSYFDLDLVFSRMENYQSAALDDKIVIRKLPQLEFHSRDKQVVKRALPVWVSLESTAGLVRRTQPLFQTRQYLERVDFAPRVMTALRWKGFSLLPSFSFRARHYGEQQKAGQIVGEDVNDSSREVAAELVMPSLSRIFSSPKWLGDKIKHVIEPRAGFRYVSGVEDFDRLIRFDETELVSNTTEVEYSITNRFYVKRGGEVREIASWQLWQRRYFDPSFGGAVVAGQRNVVLSAVEMTPYAFLDQPRHYSPVVSALRLNPTHILGVEWRSDYDPLRGQITSSGVVADARVSHYFLSLGHNHVYSVPLLTPSANQLRGTFGIGNDNRRGWNAAFNAVYDFRVNTLQFATTQVTYNTDCCGFSVQYRRFSFGTRNENQFRVAFAVANIGSFGSLKKQDRLF